MKNRYILLIFVFATAIVIFGSLLKILHYQFGAINGSVLLTIGMMTQVLACLMFVVKLLFTPKDKSNFLDK
ncbi:GldL-related protein [Flavobacterium sp. 3HN19-14]|uniref:GldL-related protein n=1 Tax=Flavobacterium sp. 3HN19-14 TaxID=3448133 RepID=UPI003EE0D707